MKLTVKLPRGFRLAVELGRERKQRPAPIDLREATRIVKSDFEMPEGLWRAGVVELEPNNDLKRRAQNAPEGGRGSL